VKSLRNSALGSALLLCLFAPHAAQAQEPDPAPGTVVLTPAQLFGFADAARDRGDYAAAETAYRALTTNPDIEIRTEARFRLALMLADKLNRYADAAIELRKILDEKPKAARVRLELARMDAMLGRAGAAARELRAAQTIGLPAEVQQVVRFYASALEAQKPFGYSFGVAIAPDTNINRATRSDTLGTVIGDFTLDNSAKAKSGVGLALQGQAYFRKGIDPRTRLLVQVSGQGSLYRQSEFNDVILAVQVGPERASGSDRFNLNGTAAWRWYGGAPFSRTFGGSGSWQHPLGKRAQIKLGGSIERDDNLRNDLQDATEFGVSADYDRAFSATCGGGIQIAAARIVASDPGYSTASGNIGTYLFREMGSVTAVVNLGYGHLEADQRLFLYPRRRIENRYSAGLAVTLRALRFGPFAPLAKVQYERNRSTIEIYEYSRFSGQLGITAAF
jgi:outer membrane protein